MLIRALPIIAFFWAHIVIFHTLPGILVTGVSGNLHALPVLGVAVVCVAVPHIFGAWGIIPLTITNFAYLVLRGSVSNHILTELCLCAAVAASAFAAFTGGAKEGTERRMQNTLGECFRKQLAALYLISALHKMNTGFFEIRTSCSSQIIAITTLQLLPEWIAKPILTSSPLLQTAPAGGLFLEILMGLGLLSGSPSVRRGTIVVAQLFHIVLALPLPPSSFYPFSAICSFAFIPLHPEACSNVFHRSKKGLLLAFLLVLWPLLTYRCYGQREKEYPPYSQYPAGVAWIMCLAFINVAAATIYPSNGDMRAGKTPQVQYEKEREEATKREEIHQSSSSSSKDGKSHKTGRQNISKEHLGSSSTPPPPRGRILSAPNVMFALVFMIGLTPYAGMRTYPAFAMFSNLQTEDRSNHWFLPGWRSWNHRPSYLEPVKIVETDLRSLHAFQVDLSPYYPEETLEGLAEIDLEAALWVCPPKWKFRLPEFVPYHIPFFELNKAVVTALDNNKDPFYVKYQRNGQAKTLTRLPSGECTGEEAERLLQPPPFWQRLFFRFRSFDPESNVCRH